MLPKVSELRHVAAGDVVGNWHTRELNDSAFDGVHERKIAHGPWEQGSFGVAGAAKEEWCCGEVHYASNTQLSLDDFKAGDPQPLGFVVFLCLFLVIPLPIAY